MRLGIYVIKVTATYHNEITGTIRYAVIAEGSNHAIDRLKHQHAQEGWHNFASTLSYEMLGPPHGDIVCLDGEIWTARLK